jgi:hypothetical protein
MAQEMVFQNSISEDFSGFNEEKDSIQNRAYSMDPNDYDLGPVIGSFF